MAITIDQNGIPTINTSAALTDAEKAEIIQSPSQPEVTFASLLRGFLDFATAAIGAVIDPVTRKFYAQVTASPVLVGEATKQVAFTPDEGQTGRSLTWNASDEGVPDTALVAALGEVVGAVQPRMTVESLLARAIAAIPEALQDKCLIEVDQTTMKVTVHQYDNAAGRVAGADSISLAGTNIVVTLAEPADAGNPAALVFEGGPTA